MLRVVVTLRSKVVLVLAAVAALGCGDGGGSSALLPPKFVAAGWKRNHGVLSAQWFITLRNDGGGGSQLVQFWVGSRTAPRSRSIVYSERHRLGSGEQKTVTIDWVHGGVGAIGSALLNGVGEGVDFLP